MEDREPWVERVIREAAEAGEFDDLPGTGKPIPDLDQPYDPDWWARRWFERQRRRDRAFDLATEVRRALPMILTHSDPSEARRRLEAINDRLGELNEPLPNAERVALLDVDRLLGDRSTPS